MGKKKVRAIARCPTNLSCRLRRTPAAGEPSFWASTPPPYRHLTLGSPHELADLLLKTCVACMLLETSAGTPSEGEGTPEEHLPPNQPLCSSCTLTVLCVHVCVFVSVVLGFLQGSKKGGKGKDGEKDEKKAEMIKRLSGGYTKRLEK
jgi:hypothetical protein